MNNKLTAETLTKMETSALNNNKWDGCNYRTGPCQVLPSHYGYWLINLFCIECPGLLSAELISNSSSESSSKGFYKPIRKTVKREALVQLTEVDFHLSSGETISAGLTAYSLPHSVYSRIYLLNSIMFLEEYLTDQVLSLLGN
jgi:hypothetical protein